MRKQMIGIAWILLGILLAIMSLGYGIPGYASVLCGLVGLITVIIYSGPDDGK